MAPSSRIPARLLLPPLSSLTPSEPPSRVNEFPEHAISSIATVTSTAMASATTAVPRNQQTLGCFPGVRWCAAATANRHRADPNHVQAR
jgi:hypothetical protein